jgi:hypothetical protein
MRAGAGLISFCLMLVIKISNYTEEKLFDNSQIS